MTTSNEHKNAPAVPQGFEPAGYLLHWPSFGGSRKVIWNESRVSGDAIGCPVTQVFKQSAATPAPAPAVPAEIDVRTILLDIVPGDGNGHEVYAKTVEDVVNKLTEMAERLDAAEAPAPAQYKDSAPHLSVGESSFESWYDQYLLNAPVHQGHKQRARDAYAAGMGDPLVAPAPAQEPDYRIDDEAQLQSAIEVMNDVLADIGDWEDQALADAVKASKRDLEAMVESIRFMAKPAQEPTPWAWLTEANIDDYLADYEMRGEGEDGCDGIHAPTDGERVLIKDAIMGLLNEAHEATRALRHAAPAQEVGLTDDERQQVFRDAENRMVREINLSWRNAVVDEVISALRAKGGK